jgi:hypothetical protein
MPDQGAMNLNEVRLDRVKEALSLTADVLRGESGEAPLQFRVLLHGFDVNRDILQEWHVEHLDWLLELHTSARNLQVLSILGHASRTGSEANNVDLSKRRAAAVSGYLLDHGLSTKDADVDGTGSAPAVIEVGRVEEPFNRSVEIIFTFRYVPRFASNLPNPTMAWTIDPGLDTGWVFIGRQKMTIKRLDTGESRTATFDYVDATWSVGPSKILNRLIPNRWVDFDKAFDEFPSGVGVADRAEKIRQYLAKWLGGFLLKATTDVAIVPGGGTPRPLANTEPLDWDSFENTYAVLLEPAAFGAPGIDASYAMLLIGLPPFAGAYVSDIDGGVGSVFPELSTGFKFGTFSLDP